MKKILIILIVIVTNFLIFPSSAKDAYMKEVFSDFYKMVDIFAEDYSKISGIYTANGELTGSASVGHFPSFRIGSTLGIIFYRNPARFLKNINIFGNKWNDTLEVLEETAGAKEFVNWIDENSLTIPLHYYHFDIGLPLGFTVGSRFCAGSYGEFFKSTLPEVYYYCDHISYWGIGANLKYTILRDHKYFPNIAVGFGVQYTDTAISLKNLTLARLNMDSENTNIPAYLEIFSHNNNTAFYIDFAISKTFKFFEIFGAVKIVQTVNHNITKLTVKLDLSEATNSVKSLYNESVTFSNVTSGEGTDYEVGKVYPVTDFIMCAGFEFIAKIVRFGVEGSFSCASQMGMVSISLRFQVEDWQFKKLGEKINARKKTSE